MQIETKLFDEVVVLSLSGEMDSRGHQQLDRSIKDLIDSRVFKVILDLCSIRFMGQQTISLLISHMKELRANGGDIRFLNPQRALMLYLKQNRVIELFKVYSTRAEAVDSFKTKIENTSETTQNKSAQDSKPSNTTDSAKSDLVSDDKSAAIGSSVKSRFETGEILYANSCMLATLIKMLESQDVISSEEASELMNYESLSLKGVGE
jgi:anti-anti-sigma factor